MVALPWNVQPLSRRTCIPYVMFPPIPSIDVRADIRWTVFEGGEVRTEQKKRIEEEVREGRMQVPEGASDKESTTRIEAR